MVENTSDNINNKLNEPRTFSLLDFIVIFLKYKRKILLFTGLVLVVTVILYFIVFDLIYFSHATVKSSSTSIGLLGALEGGLPDMSAITGGDIDIGYGKTNRELATYSNILRSRRCLEPLIIKFDLMNRDDYKYMEDAIKDFSKNKMNLEQDRLPGILDVGVFDKDPQIAKEMVEFLLEQLNKINIELSVLNARNNREFLEKRYSQAREDLVTAEDTLKHYQEIYGILPDLQIKAAAQAAFGLEGELKAEEVKLDVLKKILSADQPEVKTQEAKVNALNEKINKIRFSTDLNEFLHLGNSPQIILSYLRLQREVEIQTKIVTFLLPMYEQAKIEEKKEMPSVLILDSPVIAERKSKPKRLTMVVIFTAMGFTASILFFFAFDKYSDFRGRVISRLKNE